MSFRNKLVFGVAWSAFDVCCNQILLLVISIAIARLLHPNDYGIIGIIIAFTQLVGKIMDCGINRGLYQAKIIDDETISSAFVLFNIFALIGFFILWISSSILAKYYANPQLSPICKVMGVCFGLNYTATVPLALLTRNLNFKKIGIANIVSGIVSGIIAIIFAAMGFGVWALVTQRFLHTVIVVIMLWCFVNWHPRWSFSWKKLKPLFNFGIKIAVARLIEGGSWDFFNLLVGKTYSSTQLGLYSKSRHLAQVPYTAISSIVGRVFFQGMVSKQDDINGRRKLIHDSILVTNLCVTPFLILLFIIGNDIIIFLFGPQWNAAAPYFKIMCIMFLGGIFLTINQQSLSALGYSGNYLISTLISKSFGLLIVLILCRYNIFYFLWGLVIMFMLDALIPGIIIGKICKYSIWQQIWDCFPVIIIAIICGLISWYIQKLFGGYLALFLRLVCISLIYGVCFIGLCFLLKVDAFLLFIKLLPINRTMRHPQKYIMNKY